MLQAYARWGENGPASAFFTHVPRHTAVHTRDHTTPCGCLRLAHQCELRTHGPLSCCCAAWTTPQLPLPRPKMPEGNAPPPPRRPPPPPPTHPRPAAPCATAAACTSCPGKARPVCPEVGEAGSCAASPCPALLPHTHTRAPLAVVAPANAAASAVAAAAAAAARCAAARGAAAACAAGACAAAESRNPSFAESFLRAHTAWARSFFVSIFCSRLMPTAMVFRA